MELEKLLDEIGKIYLLEQKRKEEKNQRGEYFNVFTTLGLKTEEVRLHSAFLAELLNPHGRHGMGELFLKAFLSILRIDHFDINPDMCKPNIVERYIGEKTDTDGGRIDILIEDGKNAIIIENKIYADDQWHQLLRYNNYGKRQFPCKFLLLYLTLDGREASEESTGKEEFPYICISYRKEILDWLEKCAKLAFDKPLVRETIIQYITLVKQITYNDMDTANKDKIVDLAIEKMEAVSTLMSARTEISARLRRDFVIKPLERFASEKELTFKVHGMDNNGPIILFKKDNWNYSIAVTRDDGRDRAWRNLYIGISYFEKISKEDMLPQQKRLSCFSENSNEDWPYGWEYLPDSYRDWHSENCYLPMKNEEVTAWIKEKIENILNEIEEKSLRMK